MKVKGSKAQGTVGSGEIGVAIWQAHLIEIPHETTRQSLVSDHVNNHLARKCFQVKSVTGAGCNGNGLAAKELSGFVPHVGENISVTARWAKQT